VSPEAESLDELLHNETDEEGEEGEEELAPMTEEYTIEQTELKGESEEFEVLELEEEAPAIVKQQPAKIKPHLNRIQPPTNYKCEHCSFVSSEKASTIKHIMEVHADEYEKSVQRMGGSSKRNKVDLSDGPRKRPKAKNIKPTIPQPASDGSLRQCQYCSFTTPHQWMFFKHLNDIHMNGE